MKIGVIGAMELEVNLIKEKLDGREDSKIEGFNISLGKIGGNEVIVLLCGIGKVSSAMGAALLIHKFSPDLIINTGVAGGLRTSKVYQVLVAKNIYYNDVDVTAFGYELGQQAQMPAFFKTDDLWREKIEEHMRGYDIEMISGDLTSGDSFISSRKKREWIEDNFPKAMGVDMESGAIAQVCYILKTPVVVIRAISDKAGEENTVSYEAFVDKAGRLSAQVNIEWIKSIK